MLAGAKLRPSSLMQKSLRSRSSHSLGHIELKESDFYALQATLQTEARIALAQAKEMARIQMEVYFYFIYVTYFIHYVALKSMSKGS